MEFICVLSVGGSLAYYTIIKQNKTAYTATLKTVNAKRVDVPETIQLEKKNGRWEAEPRHDEIVKGLAQALDASP